MVDAGEHRQVLASSAGTLAEDWLRTLTVSGEPGITPDHAIELINQPSSPRVRLRTPLSAEDAQLRDAIQARNADVAAAQPVCTC